jgi:tRNA (Thr-GGU) A37 N-methylase
LIGVFFGPKVDDLDAWGGSPVLDIKPYLPQMDSKPQAFMPKWAEGRPPE